MEPTANRPPLTQGGIPRRTVKTLLSFALFCWTTVPVGALCRKMTLDEHFASSIAVFVGRAITQDVEMPADRRPWYTRTTFAVDELWKGAPEKTITIRTCGAWVEDRRDAGPVNGGWPSSISWATQPRAYTSDRGVMSRSPAACSGDMYSGVPTDIPASVMRVSDAPVTPSAMPKSATSAWPSCSR